EDLIVTWLYTKSNLQLIKDLQIDKKEAFFAYKNSIVLYQKSLSDIEKRINVVHNIIDNLPIGESENEQFDISKIPIHLRALKLLINKWAISDDVQRRILIDNTKVEEKENLVKTVFPILAEINTYISKFKEPLPSEAILLGYLV